MIVVTVNSGSTSVKLSAFESTDGKLIRIARERQSGRALNPHDVLTAFLRQLDSGTIDAVAHRVVHGGTRFAQPVRIDDAVQSEIEALSELAPLHNPVALKWISAARELCDGDTAQIAAFDTAFFSGLPRVAAAYALPESLGEAHGVRRYGFHGLAHEAMWRRWCELHPELTDGGRLITIQLGGGCSMAAIDRGRAVDTSMGFSPLEGLVMATRTGDIDAAVVPYLARRLGISCESVIERFNREAGLLGVSGISSDINALLENSAPGAQLAMELFCYRARKYLGAYLAVLSGCDGIVLGGGIGEHVPAVRERILSGMQWAGIMIEPTLNATATRDETLISSADSISAVYVIPVDEEHVLARAALSCLRQVR